MMTREKAGRVRVHVVGIFLSMLCTGICLPAAAQTAEVSGSAESAQTAAAPASAALAEPHSFNIPAGSLADALSAFSEQSGVQLIYEPRVAQEQTVPALQATVTAGEALQTLLQTSGLVWVHVNDKTIALKRPDGASADDPNSVDSGEQKLADSYAQDDVVAGVAAADESTAGTTSAVAVEHKGGIEEIIVTAQKKSENIQDVPIAISAFSSEDLRAQKLEGGFDLLKAIPNVSFSKTNFTGYNFQIRGIGTQAVSATTDPAVAVSFNSTTLITNRLFEQEYLDVQRVEVLRGPQGTLYGRNATGGVINVIPATPKIGVTESSFKYEAGNYGASRFTAMINQPLTDDLAIRGAFASTKRDGFDKNEFDGSSIDGRDLSTGRVTLGWQPSKDFRADFSWEHFQENDDRLRSAKNLCHRDNGPDQIAGVNVDSLAQPLTVRRTVEQGCLPDSLYSKNSYGTPNGDAMPFVTVGRVNNGLSFAIASGVIGPNLPSLLSEAEVFANPTQSHDLRTVYSPIDPEYQAKADLYDLSFHYQWTDALSLTSHTVYNDDKLFSTQDYTRFEATPGLFNDISGPNVAPQYANFAPKGVFCDPQLGCSDSFRAQDISQSHSTQLNQQFELASSFDGPVNFSLGVNYTHFKTQADYFYFSNALTALAQTPPFDGAPFGLVVPCSARGSGCVSVQQDGLKETAANPYGHNFFLSRNPYELNSAGIFGETYWQATDTIKFTAGLRMTWDRKVFTPVPSQTLLADYREAVVSGIPSVDNPEAGPDGCTHLGNLCGVLGNAPGGRGYPANPDIVQTWRAPTGRLVVDWTPDLPFTEATMVYASYSRGYKGGGANPPSIAPPAGNFIKAAQGAVASPTFKAEYVNAYEVGTKNTVLGGSVMLNASAFLYDYKNYQVSKIVDRSAVNENFDATIYGAELEAVFAPTLDWNANAAIGYLHTRLANGEKSIDLMDRTQGGNQFYITGVQNPNYDPSATPVDRADYVAGVNAPAGQQFLAFDDWVVVKPNAAQSSNCVAPADLVAQQVSTSIYGNDPFGVVQGVSSFCAGGTILGDQVSPGGYTPKNGAPNGGAGFYADVGGNELPNSPHFTVSLGTQYTFHLPMAWDLTGRADWYWQDKSYARVYNTDYDRLRAWTNTNFSIWAEKADWGLRVEAYVKNAFDKSPITGAFLNSDDTGLTTNVFTLDPRLVGVSITKNF